MPTSFNRADRELREVADWRQAPPAAGPVDRAGRLTHTGAMKQDLAHYAFRCPNLECGAQYVALAKDHAPAEKARCVECETPFMAKDKGRFLHYQALRFD